MSKHEMQARVSALKQLLRDTDYKAIKAGEGHPGSDWDDVVLNRQAWRDEINLLDAAIAESPDEPELT
jgi:hypothetical protein